MSKRLYEKQYHLAPYRGRIGTMECCACGKPIDPSKEDFRSAKASDPAEGWGYRTHHRKCLSDDSGFIQMEDQASERLRRRKKMLEDALVFKNAWEVCDLDDLIEQLSKEPSQ